METLLAWRDTLDDAQWTIAGEVSRQLAGGLRVPNERLRSWRLETAGYAPVSRCLRSVFNPTRSAAAARG